MAALHTGGCHCGQLRFPFRGPLAPAERHIWTDSRLPWLHLDEHLPGEPGETI